MKKIATLFSVALMGSLMLGAQNKSAVLQASGRYTLPQHVSLDELMPKTIVFKLKPQYRNVCTRNTFENAAFNQMMASVGGTGLQRVFPFTPAPETEYNKDGKKMVDLSLTYSFTYTSSMPLVKVINSFLPLGLFDYVEPMPLPKAIQNVNDPYSGLGYQWHLYKINAAGSGTTGWNVTHGDSAIVIGITDTGTEPTHPDLNGNIKRNLGDPIDGIDNDGDGYIDNYMGWDLGMNDNDPTWQGDAHGVHVSGIACAVTNNSVGVAGVGYLTKFLPVKIADATGALTQSYQGITYAADHGVKIINCSWGGTFGGTYGQSVIDYATINKDVLVVCACGNNNMDQEFYPSSFDGVVSVAATDAGDNRASFSNYNYKVSVMAPGNSIYSTYAISSGSYSNLSGTSMASPVTAGVCAMIRKQFPGYNAYQTAARLKQTTYNNYGVGSNASYANKLGTGRVDMYNALTGANGPWVETTVRNITDNNDNAFGGGDTLRITGTYEDYLGPTTNLVATLTTTSPYITIQMGSINLGALATLGTGNNNSNPFMAKLIGSPPVNQQVDFQLTFTDGTYTSSEWFSVIINVDYINIAVNDIGTTITSKSLIGFNDNPAQTQGLGFQYQSYGNLMYEGGLMVGVSGTKVSDNVRNTATPSSAFVDVQRVQQIIPAVVSNFDAVGIYSDANASSPLPITVRQKDYAWTTPGNLKYVILEYYIKNTGAGTLSNLYAGIFADYDITATTSGSNKDDFDAANKMGYAYYTGSPSLYCGTKLLTSSAPVVHYAIDNITGGGGGVDISTAYSDVSKYTTLSTNRAHAGGSGTGNDVCDVTSSGPFTILAGDSIKVAFALIAGDNLSDLQTSAVNAQTTYNGILTVAPEKSPSFASMTTFPNPANGNTVLDLNVLEDMKADLGIFDVSGKRVATLVNGELKAGPHRFNVDLSAYAEGMYVYKLVSDKGSMTKRLVVTK